MQIADLVNFNGAPPIDNRWSLVSVHQCEEEDYDVNSEDKILVGLLVSIKHCATSTSNNLKLRFGGTALSNNSRVSTFAKLRGGNMNTTYDRLLFFADLCIPGKCFAILAETVNKSDLLMAHAQHSVGVGDVFAIIEPDQVVRALQGDLPLINTSKPVNPLLNPGFALVVPLLVRFCGLTN